MNRKESISAILLLSFSAAVMYQASRYPFGTVSRVGPAFMPFYLGLALAALSLIILIKALLRPTQEDGRTPESTKSTSTKIKILRVVLVFLFLVTYAFLLGRLGFPITTFLFTLALFKFVESYGWVSSTLGALATSFVNYLVFSVWLQCQFPKGFLGI